jgi:hypothetical protein
LKQDTLAPLTKDELTDLQLPEDSVLVKTCWLADTGSSKIKHDIINKFPELMIPTFIFCTAGKKLSYVFRYNDHLIQGIDSLSTEIKRELHKRPKIPAHEPEEESDEDQEDSEESDEDDDEESDKDQEDSEEEDREDPEEEEEVRGIQQDSEEEDQEDSEDE